MTQKHIAFWDNSLSERGSTTALFDYALYNETILNNKSFIFYNQRDKYDSLRTIVKIEKTPYKMYKIENNNLVPYLKTYGHIDEPYNICRQDLPDSYLHNGYIDIMNYSLLKQNKISGDKILPYIMNKTDTIDIDTVEDWEKAEKVF